MDNPNKHLERGSAKLFSLRADDHDALAAALGIARADYEVKWWWKYGQPAIDLIRTSIEVRTELLGATVAKLMQMNGPDLQVTAGCFPLGIPKPDGFRVDVDIRRAI